MSAAQEEFNQLVKNSREISSSHPEDRDSDSPAFSDEDSKVPRRSDRHPDSSDEDEAAPNMVSSTNYHIPKHTFEANTGPKGVIADAQAFERARKKSFRQTLLSAAGLDNAGAFAAKTSREESPRRNRSGSPTSSDDDEDRFMRKWRASRMQELQSRNNRQSSPRGRVYGRVDNVDAAGYLDAIEKVTPDAIVVVCIYDPQVCSAPLLPPLLTPEPRKKTKTDSGLER